MNILVITDPSQIGGNFLTWTIHWLSGQQKYLHYKSGKFRVLPKNPLTKINAHNFKSNIVGNYQKADDLLALAQIKHSDEVNCIYLHNFDEPTDREKDAEYVGKFCSWADKIVYVNVSPCHHLYFSTYEGRVLTFTKSNPSKRHENWDQQHEEFLETYFADSKEQWNNLGLCAKWDQREFLALNIRPFESKTCLDHAMFDKEYFYIDSRDLWTCLDESVKTLFDFFELPICEDRLAGWQDIYTVWRKVHQKRIIFGWYFERIMHNILHGHSMDLSRFNLDIVQEACIQHVLIYKYGLNLKTWELKKFKNTKQLHDLLEPNLHTIIPYDIQNYL